MNLTRNKILNITLYILSITLYSFLSIIVYKLLIDLHYYYLFVTIPMLLLFITLTISNSIKLLLTIVSMFFNHNKKEITKYIDNKINSVNDISIYTLIAIFTSLLSSVMILDIILCLKYNNYNLLAISIVIWTLLYYLLFKLIIKIIKKEINL